MLAKSLGQSTFFDHLNDALFLSLWDLPLGLRVSQRLASRMNQISLFIIRLFVCLHLLGLCFLIILYTIVWKFFSTKA